ncbi:MAG: domain S-box [Bacteriovoracaceae bacterium]|nr:domain S-box [Bacteriovoracaceae bacterium]
MGILTKLFPGEMGLGHPSGMKLWLQSGTGQIAFDEIDAGEWTPILNSLSDGLILIDTSANTKVFNRAALKLLGRKPLNQCALFHSDKITQFDPEKMPLKRALAGEEVDYIEAFLRTPAYPEGIFIEIGAAPIRDQWGHIYGAVALLRDISKRKIAEEELRHSKFRFETFSHMVNDYVWEWDLLSDISWRQGRRNAYGYCEEEIRSADKWWREKIHPEDRERIFSLHEELINGIRPSWRAEYRWRKNDGSYVYVIGQAHVTRRDEHNRPIYIMGASLDITDRRVTEERLAQLALIVESTEDAVFSIDLNRTILSWNQGAEKLFGYTAEEAIGRDAGFLGDPDAAVEEAASKLMPKILNGESIQRFEMWRKKKNGERMLLSYTVSPTKNEKGEVAGVCVVARDITDLRKAEDEVRRLASNLARSNEELKQFAYVASHDISEPLRTMSNFASLLKMDYLNRLDSSGQESVNFIIDASNRMKHLIDSLLNYSQVEQTSLNLQRVDCALLIERLKIDLKSSLENSKAELIVGDLPTVNADEVQLNQLFQNFISNALKFFRNAPPRVTISGKRDGEEWIFSVKDEGIGIDPNHHGRIFQTFQRLNSNGEFPGGGLGLATCKKIVDRHGGRIWVESFPGHGTTFYFSIPALLGIDQRE